MERSKDLLQMELAIAWVLRGGVALSGLFVAVGLFLRIFEPGNSQQMITQLLAGQPFPSTVGQPDSIIKIGLMILIALPILRVAMTVFLFLKEKDYVYLAITLFVLSVLMTGVIFGKSI
jgi:uncharacterized membrane protein